jgi:hypothetical protein
MSRLFRVLTKLSLPGWLLLGWAVLAEIHELNFVIDLWDKFARAVEAHFVWDLIAGFAWLTLVIWWPDIKRRLPPGIALPKTLHEKVHRLNEWSDSAEQRLVQLDGYAGELKAAQRSLTEGFQESLRLQNESNDGHAKIRQVFTESIHTLQDDRTTAIQERGKLDVRIEELTRRVRFIENALKSSFTFCDYFFEITRLIWAVEEIMATFSRIIEMYGDLSPVVTKPFSAWRLPVRSLDPPSDDSIRDGERWARSLEEYLERAQMFRQTRYGDYFHGDLVQFVATWRSYQHDASSNELLRLLMDHRKALLRMRGEYVTAFISGGLASSGVVQSDPDGFSPPFPPAIR